MPETLPDFQAVLIALTQNNVRFVLIGGLAMAAYGSAHVTQDIDAGYARDRQNIAAIHAAFAHLHPRLRGFPVDLPFVWDVQTLRAAANLTLDTDVSPVDLLGEIAGVDSFEGRMVQRSRWKYAEHCPDCRSVVPLSHPILVSRTDPTV